MKVSTFRLRQICRNFPDDISNAFSWIKIYEFLLRFSLKFVPEGPINNIPLLVQIRAWRRPGDKPLPGPMMFRLPTHIFVTRPQWVKGQLKETNARVKSQETANFDPNIWYHSGETIANIWTPVSLLTHICVTWPQWFNYTNSKKKQSYFPGTHQQRILAISTTPHIRSWNKWYSVYILNI